MEWMGIEGGLGEHAKHFLLEQEFGLKPLLTSLSLVLLLRALYTTGVSLLLVLFFEGVMFKFIDKLSS